MIRLDCPNCKKDSYSSAVEPFRPCPYCGEVYSGKYGPEKRNGKRLRKEITFVFRHNSYSFDATISDASKNGLGIKIFGSIFIPHGDVIDLDINNLFAKAQIRWINSNPDLTITIAGCRILSGSLNIT